MDKILRLEDFPLKFAALKTRNRSLRSAQNNRHPYQRDDWFIKSQKRYETVQLALVIRESRYSWPRKYGWMLAYEGELSTGIWDTREEAIDWYLKDGR